MRIYYKKVIQAIHDKYNRHDKTLTVWKLTTLNYSKRIQLIHSSANCLGILDKHSTFTSTRAIKLLFMRAADCSVFLCFIAIFYLLLSFIYLYLSFMWLYFYVSPDVRVRLCPKTILTTCSFATYPLGEHVFLYLCRVWYIGSILCCGTSGRWYPEQTVMFCTIFV